MSRFITTVLMSVMMVGCQAADPYVVRTTNGPVKGFEEEGTMAFKLPHIQSTLHSTQLQLTYKTTETLHLPYTDDVSLKDKHH